MSSIKHLENGIFFTVVVLQAFSIVLLVNSQGLSLVSNILIASVILMILQVITSDRRKNIKVDPKRERRRDDKSDTNESIADLKSFLNNLQSTSSGSRPLQGPEDLNLARERINRLEENSKLVYSSVMNCNDLIRKAGARLQRYLINPAKARTFRLRIAWTGKNTMLDKSGNIRQSQDKVNEHQRI